ncbi:MAG: PD-(D/E)XK nuclease family protein [Patescibacteria group bacterium]
MKTITLGPTKLRLWNQCQLAFAFQHIERLLPDTDSIPAALGRAMHELSEGYTAYCWKRGIENDRQHGMELTADIESRLPFGSVEDFHGLAVMWVDACIVPHKTMLCGLEDEIGLDETTFELVPYEEATLRGRLDRWTEDDGSVLLADSKSSHVMPAQDEVDNDVQLAVSSFLLWRKLKVIAPNLDVWRIVVQLEHFRFIGYHDKGIRRAEFYPDKLERIGRWIKRQVEAIRVVERGDREARPTVGDHCRNCQFIRACPAFGAAIPEALTTFEEAETWAKGIRAAETDLARRRATMRAWVADNGPLPGSEVATRETMTATAQQVVDVVLAHGGKIEDALALLKPDNATIRKLPEPVRLAVEAGARWRTDTTVKEGK